MPNYTQFQGDDFITDPFSRVAASIKTAFNTKNKNQKHDI